VRNRFATFLVFSLEPENEPFISGERRGEMLLLIVLAVLAIILFGVGFAVHWLFIVAAIVAIIWLISLFVGGFGGRRGARL
jgi:energy-coupling factor transporter transmembrane protein EcfT